MSSNRSQQQQQQAAQQLTQQQAAARLAQQQAAALAAQQAGQVTRTSVPAGMAHLLNPAQSGAMQGSRPGAQAQQQQQSSLIYPTSAARGSGNTPPPIDPSSTALLDEIFGRSSGTAAPAPPPAARRTARTPILARDYVGRPTPLAWRKGQFLVDFQHTTERRLDQRRWICPCCDFKDYDAYNVMDHYVASHTDRRRSEDSTQLLRSFLNE